MTTQPVLMKLADAAAYTSQSPDTLKKASRITDPRAFPPPLRAKRQGTAPNAALMFLRADLDDWVERFPDAS
ncbi:hypothetical protein [Terrabacter terrigena]|uniref:AlpA family transcriptional regulator n=1 Tax=Terrabacter terrigena TaxID=574718 RepID=A0ABW3N261_9MICO